MKCRMRPTTSRRKASSSMLLTTRSLTTIRPSTITLSTPRPASVNELPGRAVVGKVGDVVEIDEDQVRLVARPDGAEATGETGRSRVADRGMAQNLVREAGTRLRLADRRGEAKQLHRPEHALHVPTASLAP